MADLKRQRRYRITGKYSTKPGGSAGTSPATRLPRPASPSPAKRIALEKLAGTSAEPDETTENQDTQPKTFADETIAPDFTKKAEPENELVGHKDSTVYGKNGEAETTADVVESEATPQTNAGNTTAVNDEENEISEEAGNENIRVSVRDKIKSKKAKIALLFGSIGVTVSIVGVVAFLPTFLMNQMTSKLTEAFMDTSAYALRVRAEAYIRSYITKVIGPSYTNCGVKVARNCNVFTPGQSLPSRLYTTWRNNKIEEKLFNRYGLEFEMDTREPNKINIFRTDANGVRSEAGVFGRNSATREVSRMITAETRFQGVLDRRHMRSLLSGPNFNARKFCLIACGKRDNFADVRLNALGRLKAKLIGRTVAPFHPRLATFMLCYVIKCTNAAGEAKDAALAVINTSDKELIQTIAKEIALSGAKSFKQFAIRRLGTFVIRKVILRGASEAVKEVTVKTFLSAIPVAGWAYFGITVADFVDKMDEHIENGDISKYLREVNEEAYASYAANFLYGNDDTISFEASMQDAGALFSLVKGFSASRLSQSIGEISPKSTVECKDVTLSGEDDPLVCPEKRVQPVIAIEEIRKNPNLDRVIDIANSYGKCYGATYDDTCYGVRPSTVIRPLLNGFTWLSNKAADFVLDGVRSIPEVGEVIDSAAKYVQDFAAPIIEDLAQDIFPLALDGAAEGFELFDQFAAGMDVINNRFLRGYEDEDGALQGLGAKKLTAQESGALRQQIAMERKEDYKSKSFFARYFDMGSTQSLASISTLAMAENTFGRETIDILPEFNGGAYIDTVASAVGLSKKTSALETANRESIFGITQYGFAVDDPALNMDPELLTPETCEQYSALREASKFTNEETGQVEYGNVDLCMLDRVVVDAFTKAFDLDLEPDLNTPADSPYDVSTGFIKGTPINPDALDLRAACPTSPTISQIGLQSDAYFNKQQKTIMLCSVHGVQINTTYAKQFDDMFNAMATEGYTIRGTAGYRSSAGQNSGYNGGSGSGTFATPGMSLHQFAIAADINCQGGGQSYSIALTHRGRAGFLETISQYPCLNWIATNSKNYGLLLQCVGESSRQGGGEIRRDDGGCEWWHVSPTGG